MKIEKKEKKSNDNVVIRNCSGCTCIHNCRRGRGEIKGKEEKREEKSKKETKGEKSKKGKGGDDERVDLPDGDEGALFSKRRSTDNIDNGAVKTSSKKGFKKK